jgi:hypothetical protein
MISWDPETNCLLQWQIPNWPQPLRFTGWGVEVGNFFGFFAHERLGGRACRIEQRELNPTGPDILGSTWHIRLPKAWLRLRTMDEVAAPNQLHRQLWVSPLHNSGISWLGDAVLRLVVPWEKGLMAEVEGREIPHQGSNFYHDTEGQEVALRWPDGRRLQVKWVEYPNVPPALTPYLYVRDQPAMPRYPYRHCAVPGWVVHARVLVDYPASFLYYWSRVKLWDRGILGRYLNIPKRFGHRWRAGEWGLPGRGHLFGLWPLISPQEINFSIKITAI